MKNYYKLLGISHNVDLIAIKKAYRKLALEYHPDRSSDRDAAKNFIQITEAYEVLKDELKRAEYDVLYKEYYTSEETTENNFEEKYEYKYSKWEDLGKKKAEEYSSMSYAKFVKILFGEAKIGIRFIPNAIAILFVAGMAIVLIEELIIAIKEDSIYALTVVLVIISLIYLAYRLFLVAKADYIEYKKNKN